MIIRKKIANFLLSDSGWEFAKDRDLSAHASNVVLVGEIQIHPFLIGWIISNLYWKYEIAISEKMMNLSEEAFEALNAKKELLAENKKLGLKFYKIVKTRAG